MNNQSLYGIPEKDFNTILNVLKGNKKIHEIVIFGSRAKGTHQDGSDIDIALKGDNLIINDIIEAQLEIEKIPIPYKLDLVIFDRITEPALTDHINRVGIILYTRHH